MGLQNHEGYWKIATINADRLQQRGLAVLQVTDEYGTIAGYRHLPFTSATFGKDVSDVMVDDLYALAKKMPEYADADDVLNAPKVYPTQEELDAAAAVVKLSWWKRFCNWFLRR